MDNKTSALCKSGNYAFEYLKLYMDKCEKDLKGHLLPIQCLLVMIDRISREMPYAHKDLRKVKIDMIEVINKVFNQLENKETNIRLN